MNAVLPHEKSIEEHENTIFKLRQQNRDGGIWTTDDIQNLEDKLSDLKKKVYSNLTPWERITICRHPNRPHGIDYLNHVFDSFTELSGDRCYADDGAIIGGLGKIGDEKFVVIAQEKGCDTEDRVRRNFGMPHPEGYRKALRLMKLAEKFSLPIVNLIDTQGAYPGLEAEERGQGWAIALNLREMMMISTPIIVLVIGEGSSGGALGMGIGDHIAMLEHAYYSVISPEACASILWKDPTKNTTTVNALKLNSENLKEFGIIDTIVKEPMGGAHHDHQQIYKAVKKFILGTFKKLRPIPVESLLEQRYQKFRAMGCCQTGDIGDTETP